MSEKPMWIAMCVGIIATNVSGLLIGKGQPFWALVFAAIASPTFATALILCERRARVQQVERLLGRGK